MILFAIVGLLCFLYYFAIAVAAKRFDTTFSGFWAGMGIFFLILGRVWSYFPKGIQITLAVLFAAMLFFFLAVEKKIAAGMIKKVPEDLEYLIVLGAHVRGKKVTDSLKRRLDRAISYKAAHKDVLLVVSGGKGTGEEISEALAMKRYLVKEGIPETDIVMEDASTSTYENLKYSAKLIPEYQKKRIGIVSNNFHIYRALQIAEKAGYKAFGVPASTKPVVLPNYMVREFFAEMKRIWWTKFAR